MDQNTDKSLPELSNSSTKSTMGVGSSNLPNLPKEESKSMSSSPKRGGDLRQMTKWIFGVALVTVVTLVVLVLLPYFTNNGGGIDNVRITNLTANSATISWTTDSEVNGRVLWDNDNSFLPLILESMNNNVSYDDRDVDQNENAEYVLQEENQRITHHVTLRNLDPETEYFFRVGDGSRYFSNDVASFTTAQVLDTVQTPEPMYGEVQNESGENVSEGIVYYQVYNPDDEEISDWYSVTISDKGSYSADIGYITDRDTGAPYKINEEDNVAIFVFTPEGNQEHFQILQEYQPLRTLIVEEEKDVLGLTKTVSAASGYCSGNGGTGADGNFYGCTGDTRNTENACNWVGAQIVDGDKCVWIGGEAIDQAEESQPPTSQGPAQTVGETAPDCRGRCNGAGDIVGSCYEGPTDDDGGFQCTCFQGSKQIAQSELSWQTDPAFCSKLAGQGQLPNDPSVNVTINNVPNEAAVANAENNTLATQAYGEFQAQQNAPTINDWINIITSFSTTVYRGDMRLDVNVRSVDPVGDSRVIVTLNVSNGAQDWRREFSFNFSGDLSNPITDATVNAAIEGIENNTASDVYSSQIGLVGDTDDMVLSCRINNYINESDIVSVCNAQLNNSNSDPYSFTSVRNLQAGESLYYFDGQLKRSTVDGPSGDGGCFINTNNMTNVNCNQIIEENQEANTPDTSCDIDGVFTTNAQRTQYCQAVVDGDDAGVQSLLRSYYDKPIGTDYWGGQGQFIVNKKIELDENNKCKITITESIKCEDYIGTSSQISTTEVLGASTNSGIEPGVYTINVEGYQSKTIYITDENVSLEFFEDTNGDGEKQEDEQLIEGISFDVALSKEESITKYNLVNGWNLVGFKGVNEDWSTASELLATLNIAGASVTHISTFENGDWQLYSSRVKNNGEIVNFGEDFTIVPGRGYYIRSHNTKDVNLTSRDFAESVPINTTNGWNLVSIQSDTQYSADSLLSACTPQNLTCDSLARYQSGLYEIVVKQNGTLFGNDFDLNNISGYFLRITDGGGVQFTP